MFIKVFITAIVSIVIVYGAIAISSYYNDFKK